MKAAIMQPYLLPYIGYFQLMAAVDTFVYLDHVQYIRRGWVNRNRILNNNGTDFLFTFPVEKAPQQTPICEMKWAENFEADKAKFFVQLKGFYSKAPFYAQTVELVADSLQNLPLHLSIVKSTGTIAKALNIQCDIRLSSEVPHNEALTAQDMIIDIAKSIGADHYINPIGGTELYQSAAFEAVGLKLNFIKTTAVPYTQFGSEFVPFLSIVDVLMFNGLEGTQQKLSEFQLV